MSRRNLRQLENDMANATSYEQWAEAGREYDRVSGAEDWRLDLRSNDYDYALITSRLNNIRLARAAGDVKQLVFCLHEGLHGNLGNIANPELYKHSKVGTKYFITEYLNEVCDALDYICDNKFTELPLTEKLYFFESTAHAFGRTSLMLSGGATLGMFHIGVVKALQQQGLLPKVISGSSAGSIIAAVVGTHTDDELLQVIDPHNLNLDAFRFVGWNSIVDSKAILSGDHLAECLTMNIPDMTFEESFVKTGRYINMMISGYEKHQESRLMNALTSPNVSVSQASLASCAVPWVFPPVSLTAKDYQGNALPYLSGRKWIDGSVSGDLPLKRLSRLFGVNHSIVSQTNPHVTPFMHRTDNPRGWSRKGYELLIRNFQMTASFLLKQAEQNVQSDQSVAVVNKVRSIVKQRYVGDINLIPPRSMGNLRRVFENPSPQLMDKFMVTGEAVTWPRIEMIRNSTQISRTFEACLDRLHQIEAEKLKPSS